MNGYDVKDAYLLFVKRGEQQEGRPPVKAFRIHIDLDQAEKLFQQNLEIIKTILEREEPPEIVSGFSPFSYPCNYCVHRSRCWLYE